MNVFAFTQGRQGQAVWLIALAVVIVVLFAAATLLVNAYGRLESRLGTEWYDRGISDLAKGKPEVAVIDLRTALSYSREASYRLELARALVAAGRTQEAREYLLSLWERQPGSAELNLELARVSAISQAIPAAIGYYEAAIYGAWDNSPDLNRRNTRLELVTFLLAHNEKRRAIAVLAALASDLPSDPALHTQVGDLFLRAGDAESARLQFEAALRVRRDYLPAIQGAGSAEFALNNFPAAERFLQAYLRARPEDQNARTMLSVSRMALSLDPLAPRIGSAERRNRALRLFQDAQQRVADCATKLGTPMPPPDVQAVGTKLASQAPNANDRSLRDNPDLIEDLFSVAAGAITVTSKWCGAQHPEDDAVAALAQLHGARP